MPAQDDLIGAAVNSVEGKVLLPDYHSTLSEKDVKNLEVTINANSVGPDVHLRSKEDATVSIHDASTGGEGESDQDGKDPIIITGADAANLLLPMRDDLDPAITVRGMFLATGLSAFQACMSQIYYYKPTLVTLQGTFIVLIAYFIGEAWAALLPRADRAEARWRAKGNADRPVTAWIKFLRIINPGPWRLKEHAICAITANSASNAISATQVFAAQSLFYGVPLRATTVILTLISVALFGYGLAGIFRPITVWPVEAVYWSQLPTVKTLQGLHWQDVKNSKPMRYFWYAFGTMFCYEFLPAYIWPWLNSVSIPCLASMNASGNTASILTNLFGGATNNEGLGLFSLSFDWQYITSFQTSLPLKFQIHQAAGLFTCMIIMLAIYYGNGWNAQSQPFMSTALRTASGGRYPIAKVFDNGVLNEAALTQYGVPALSGTFAFALFIANAAIGALIMHCILFYGKDIRKSIKLAKKGQSDDRHHNYMAATYKDVPHWWYAIVLLVAFILGLVVVLKEDITLPVWAYIVSLILGAVIAPFSAVLYSRYGNGIATNNLSKMLAGLLVPGRPVGNMYFAAWSHTAISNCINMSGDLKMGEYLKIAPRAMLASQLWGVIFGGFINYAVMISIINNNAALLVDGNGNSAWSGASIQAYNTNATAWALASHLYQIGREYYMVPMGLLIGAGVVTIHYIVALHCVLYSAMLHTIADRLIQFVPRIGKFNLSDINFAQYIQYAGYIPYNQSQTCVLFSWMIGGFYVQYYLRNYKPRIFKDYSYLVTAAWDGAVLFATFILSFAVLGAGGSYVPFPQWWGNNIAGNYDLCPVPE